MEKKFKIIHSTIKNKLLKNEKGQVLVFILVMVIIVVFMTLIVFDVGHIIKGKMKSRTGVDSAALVAAQWQRNSLNLIGEINLIKVSSTMWDFTDSQYEDLSEDKPPEVRYNARDDAVAAGREMTELQLRIAFVGPLIGFAAAQQAAKNNGVHSDPDAHTALSRHCNMIENGDVYASGVIPEEVYGFRWGEPYAKMLRDILFSSNGKATIAVAANMETYNTPYIYSQGGIPVNAYANKRVLRALLSTPPVGYCAIKNLIENYENDFARNKWWGEIIVKENSVTPTGSEILPLNIEFSRGTHGPYNAASYITQNGTSSNYLDNSKRNPSSDLLFDVDVSGNNSAKFVFEYAEAIKYLQASDFAIYDSDWTDYSFDKINYWESYLVGNFRPEAAYNSGAVAYMSTRVDNKTLLVNYFQEGGKLPTIRNSKRKYYYFDEIITSSLAKPLGSLELDGTKFPPHLSSMVLPVFNDVTMLPVALEFPGYSMLHDPAYFAFRTKYLPELGKRNSIEEMEGWIAQQDNPEYYTHYHEALLKLDDPAYRQGVLDWLNTEFKVGEDELGRPIYKTNRDLCGCYNEGSGSGPGPSPPLH
ncbi:Tad domain-containing protein [Lentisphaerota bacterium WC36G]|nr:Tad domain-containing protein [Lentisphaerae bacterium WC36]